MAEQKPTVGACIQLPRQLHDRIRLMAARAGQSIGATILDLLTQATKGKR